MEEFRQIGEVLGSLRTLMVLQGEFQVNRRQCCLLFDIFCLAFNIIAEEIRLNLKIEEKNTKWSPIDNPLRELQKIFKEGELYVKQCMDKKDWWVKAINLHQNKDSVELHIHNLLCHFPAFIEAIEMAGEIAGLDQYEIQRRRVTLTRKYDAEWNDPKLFQFRFGNQYLIPREICSRFESAWREDRWNLVEALREKKSSESVTKNQQRLASLLIRKIIGSEASNGELFPSSILYCGDYQVRRRLWGQYKEIQWLGDNFVLRNFFGDVEPLYSEISKLLSLTHPNILQYLCGFYDEEKKEVLLILELMNKDLGSYMKENYGSRRRILFPLHVVVDLMLQIARGMEYLHSKKIYHGELNASNIFLKSRNNVEGCFHLKISGYGLSDVKPRSSPNSSPRVCEPKPFIWYAPEVMIEQEQSSNGSSILKYSEKADVYSFGMLCFELLAGKQPFEGHVEKMSRNILAGERPLFPYTVPKYLVNLAKKCWHTDPNQRPSFSSICRILRYIKKFLVMNPDHDYDQPEVQCPIADYCEIETWFARKFTANETFNPLSVAQIPFQMFAYRLVEKDRTIMNTKDKNGELTIEGASTCRDDIISIIEDPLTATSDTKSVGSDVKSRGSDTKSVYSDVRSVYSEVPERRTIRFRSPPKRLVSTKTLEKRVVMTKKNINVKAKKSPGATNGQSTRSSTLNRVHSTGVIRENRSSFSTGSFNRGRQQTSGHTSD
ncbi:putative serine/threonine-protein kinase [Gossypium australe]|uniref:Putative serine/threonine-protein kinase n=1 Tax=Gossypium australe TaxID=47621 RepID=A0A5B6UE38_9ROSI|nr:putative serine/threonine-protein kinase [Gossypium australe]